MIPKKIYYCWFGDREMTEFNKRCVESWKLHCPDYEIIKISEENYDYKSNPYALAGYETGDWSAVSNAARLEFLKKDGGGFYLDTDVELYKSLDELRVYSGGFITEFDSGEPDSGILGCEKFPKYYEETLSRLVPGTILHKEFIKLLYRDYDVHGERLRTYDDGFTVIGEEYFPSVRTGLFTENTIGIHYFENTWRNIEREITDDFYPFPRIKVFLGNKLLYTDSKPEIKFVVRNCFKLQKPKDKNEPDRKWFAPDMVGRTLYFFNPRVIKLITKDFIAERINYDETATTKSIITASGMIVRYIDD